MIQCIYHLSVEEIANDHACEPGETDHPYYDSDGDPSPGWYVDLGSPGCLADAVRGPFENASEAWDEATDYGTDHNANESEHVSMCRDGERRMVWETDHILMRFDPKYDDDRVPYFVPLSQNTIDGLRILDDWGYSFVDVPEWQYPNDLGGKMVWDTAVPEADEDQLRSIRDGVASGSWMPCVEYAKAIEILAHVVNLDTYFEDADISISEIVEGSTSLHGMACKIASRLAESVADAILMDADSMLHQKEDRKDVLS
ncbi:MAG: hypothetical protein GY876_03525 [Planctomycetes bacterium]|nr:hypothetical protein [Planctomycetota bacterium]MCP4887097.1 hypothetical protein [Planctomycetaceae bacterium]